MFSGRFNMNDILIDFCVGFLMCNVKVIVGVVDVLELCGFKVENVKRFNLMLLNCLFCMVSLEIGYELE